MVPAHHHLRLGEHEVVEPVDLAIEHRNRGSGARPLRAQAVMGAHEEHGAHDREEQHADEERERGDLVLVERFEGVEIGEPERERIALRRSLAGRPQQRGGKAREPMRQRSSHACACAVASRCRSPGPTPAFAAP